MSNFEDKYGIKETESTAGFHRSRRMFCVRENQLFVAPPALDYSHAVWFKNEGWMSEDDDAFLEENLRGYVSEQGDVYIYAGYDFRSPAESDISCFVELLSKLVATVPGAANGNLFSGLTRNGSDFVPIADLGQTATLLRSFE